MPYVLGPAGGIDDKLLRNGFSEGLHAKFAVAPLEEEDYHRPKAQKALAA